MVSGVFHNLRLAGPISTPENRQVAQPLLTGNKRIGRPLRLGAAKSTGRRALIQVLSNQEALDVKFHR